WEALSLHRSQISKEFVINSGTGSRMARRGRKTEIGSCLRFLDRFWRAPGHLKQLALFQLHIPNRKLAKEFASFFDGESAAEQSTGEPPCFLDDHRAGGNDPGRNGSLYLHTFGTDWSHEFSLALLVDVD